MGEICHTRLIRLNLTLETLTLILRPKSAIFSGGFRPRIRVRVSGPTFNTLFKVRVRFRVISGYDVMLNMSTGVYTKLQTLV